MERIDLPSPVLRQFEKPYIEFTYPVNGRTYLPIPQVQLSMTFEEVLTSRITRRTFAPIGKERLSVFCGASVRCGSQIHQLTRGVGSQGQLLLPVGDTRSILSFYGGRETTNVQLCTIQLHTRFAGCLA
jgi:hypothetical protein